MPSFDPMSGCSSVKGSNRTPKTPLHVRRRGLAERRQAELKRVAAHRRIADGVRQRFHRHLGRREIGVPRTDVDDVDALLHEPALDGRDLGHRVGR